MRALRFFSISAITLIGATSFAATINCTDKNQDKFLCTQVIDLSKLDYVNCLEEIGDGFEANLCKNITIPSEDGSNEPFNCLNEGKSTSDPYIIDRCSRLPNPNSVVKTNCWEDLEDGYQVNLCTQVDTIEQESVHKKIMQQN